MAHLRTTNTCEQCGEEWTSRFIRYDEDLCMAICPDCMDKNKQEQAEVDREFDE